MYCLGKKIIFCLLSTLCLLPLRSYGQTDTHRGFLLHGRVIDHATGKGIGFASLQIEASSQGVVCDAEGRFRFPRLREGTYSVEVSCLNYAPVKAEIRLKQDTAVVFRLHEQRFTLPDVEVMASFRPSKGSNATIGQTALEYIQPVSIADVLLLLPGSITGNNSLHRFNLTTSRQAGADKNTSLGMGIIADGIPMTNDAMRTQLYGLSGEEQADRMVNRRGMMNAGMDMRTFSTDHIESIEVVRGISSARDGNLSSGAIHIHSKKGATPLRVRAKADPLNKLLYMGKGFKLSERAGALHVGFDALSSTPDVREKLEQFTRITAQAGYTNQFSLHGKPLDFSARLSATSSVNNVKSDELIDENNEYYQSDYLRTTFSLNTKWHVNTRWLNSMEISGSADITRDLLKRHKLVLSSMGPSSMPVSDQSGEHEGIFLPVKYYTDYKVDNIPIYLFMQTHFTSFIPMGKQLHHSLMYGVEVKSNKNTGEGAVVDVTRPPYPGDNTFIRPRPNYLIPALINGALYIEDKAVWEASQKVRADLRLGLRATRMFNLPSDYALKHKILIEPRLQVGMTIKSETSAGSSISNTFRIGYGEENKLPTLDMLYPDRLYRDFVVLNAFYQQPNRDLLLVNTYIHTPVNPSLRENKNRKWEIGWDLRAKHFEVSLSAFREEYKGGFSYFPQYYPVAFTRYITPRHSITGKPSKDDYYPENYKDFTIFPVVRNSARTIKRGVEYRIKTPVIKPLSTSVELNGAYYSTVYTKGIPVMYRPVVKEFGDKYPYVGIYQGDTHVYQSRFNTNVWINTHIKRFGLIFTNFVQVIWFAKMRNGTEEDVLPSHYMDLDGKHHVVNAAEMAVTEGGLRHLRRERSELYYRTETKPVSVFMNIKASKELGKHTKLSFFVNNLIDINPHYKAADKTTEKEWAIPFFGAELIINI